MKVPVGLGVALGAHGGRVDLHHFAVFDQRQFAIRNADYDSPLGRLRRRLFLVWAIARPAATSIAATAAIIRSRFTIRLMSFTSYTRNQRANRSPIRNELKTRDICIRRRAPRVSAVTRVCDCA